MYLEFLPGGDPCWDGADGIINKIRDILNLHNSRSRAQIRRVLTLVRDAFEEGNVNIDAGVKLNAKNSGRKRKLNEDQDCVVAKALHFGFEIEMATMIVNHKRGVGAEVCPSTVRRSAHKAFGGKCHNRATKKTVVETKIHHGVKVVSILDYNFNKSFALTFPDPA